MKHSGNYNRDCDCPTCSVTRFIELAIIDLSVETGDALKTRVTVEMPLVKLIHLRDHISMMEGYAGLMLTQVREYESVMHMARAFPDQIRKEMVPAFTHKMAIAAAGMTTALLETVQETEQEYANNDDATVLKRVAEAFNIKLKG